MTKKRKNKQLGKEIMEEINEYESSKDVTAKVDLKNILEKNKS